MPNHLKFCGCRACRRGRHAGGKFIVRAAVRRARRKAKAALKAGETPPPVAGVPYTD